MTNREQYEKLATEWCGDTGLWSTTSHIIRHKNYKLLVGMGRMIVPYIIEDFEKYGTHSNTFSWGTFELLSELTGAQPVRVDHQGRVNLVIQDWIKWYHESITYYKK